MNNTIKSKIDNVCNLFPGSYSSTICDPVQNHAIYGISKEYKNDVKNKLKALGANKFRFVQPLVKGNVIICFNTSKMI